MDYNYDDLTSEEKDQNEKQIQEYLKLNPKIKDFGEFLEVFQNETDRGAVLVATTLIEEKLKKIIENFLVETKVTNEILTGFNAPIGTYSARLKLAFTLGLITDIEFHDCNLIRKIRNEFAHKFDLGFSFKNELVKKLCCDFKADFPGKQDVYKDEPRILFVISVGLLISRWLYREDYVLRHRLKYKEWE